MKGAGCEYCRGYWSGTYRTGNPLIHVGLSQQSDVFQCRQCHSYWVEVSGNHPHTFLEQELKMQFPELFEGLERPDDGNPWIR
jgi:hypothetical protein